MLFNYLLLVNVDVFKVIFEIYDLLCYYDQYVVKVSKCLLGGFKLVCYEYVDCLYWGLLLCGLCIELMIDLEGYIGEGDLFVFVLVLNEFFVFYVSINFYYELWVRSIQGDVY